MAKETTYPRLYRQTRDGIYYLETARNQRKSLRTTDPNTAQKLLERYLEAAKIKSIFRVPSPGKEPSKTLAAFLAEYLKEREQDHSPQTLRADALPLRLLGEVIGRSAPLNEITEETLLHFRDLCTLRKENPIKPVSMNCYLRHIRAALNWARKKKYIQVTPAIPFFRIKEKPLPRFLQPEEIERIITKTQQIFPDFYPMLLFYLWTGTRRLEALSLHWTKISLEANNPYAIVKGKGSKERMIPLMPEIASILKNMQQPAGPIFRQLDESTITHRFKKICRACDPPVNARLHDLRHTAATYMLSKGIPMKIVQEILGHQSITTTVNIYGGVLNSSLFTEMQKLNFRD